MQNTYDKLVEKWAPVLNEESSGAIKDPHRRAVTAAILENQEIAFAEQSGQANYLNETAPANNTANVANWNPVLISLVRRAMPNLMAYDVCGVQPMAGPTGLIFAMKSNYKTAKAGVASGAEALFGEAAINFSGDSSTVAMGADPSGTLLLTHLLVWTCIQLLKLKTLVNLAQSSLPKWVSPLKKQQSQRKAVH